MFLIRFKPGTIAGHTCNLPPLYSDDWAVNPKKHQKTLVVNCLASVGTLTNVGCKAMEP